MIGRSMGIKSYSSPKHILSVLGLTVVLTSFGCQQDNEAEFLKTLPSVPKDEFAGESVSQRRSRTRQVSKAQQKFEAKLKADEEKKAAAAAKTTGGS